MKRKRNSSKQESGCNYDTLNVFKRSLEELTNIVGDIVHRDGRLSCEMQNLDKQITRGSSKRKSSLQNSIIVINDSDSDDKDNEKDNDYNKTSDEDKNDASLSIIECNSILSSPLQQKKRSGLSTKQNTNRSSVISYANDSSVVCLSDTQEFLNGEKTTPSQTEDDVVELWSCLGSLNMNKAKKNVNEDVRCNSDEPNVMFVIDKTPNLSYLKWLRSDTKYPQKRKIKRDLSLNKAAVKSFVKPIKQSTLTDKRKKQYNNKLNLSLTKLNIRKSNKLQRKTATNCKEKTEAINSDENHRANSNYKLREIIVDGCNVAMNHTHGKEFSEKGIEIVVNYFKERGHVVKVFLPQHVRRKEYSFLEQLYKEGIVIFTPSRKIGGKQITSYDDRFILKYATSCGGIVISSDQYRDLYKEKPEWRNTIQNRLLIPTFVGDYIMFPEDPLGRFGPNLERFLRHS